MCSEQIMVSIRCTAYNHENYIRQCLDGFVMQKTNFRFEAVVHDDASTDATAQIIREYAEKYPDIIKPIYETENQYSKHDGSISRIMNAHMHGKYIAMCEGDDYWTDLYKLQKQVDFLEEHSDYSMCFHNAMQHFESDGNNGRIEDCLFSNIDNKDYTGVEIYKEWIVPTASVLFKREILFTEFYKTQMNNPNFIFGDIVLFLMCTKFGKIRGMKDVMSVYRRHTGGLVLKNNQNIGFIKKFFLHTMEIYRVFGDEYKEIATQNNVIRAYVIMFKSKDPSYLKIAIKESFTSFLIGSCKMFFNTIKGKFLNNHEEKK